MTALKVIFIVDANAIARRATARALQRAGWSLRLFGEPRDALAAVEQLPPDLVVADADLGEMAGVGFLARLRRRAPFARTILVSGADLPSEARRAFRRDVVDALACRPLDRLFVEMARQLLGEQDDDWLAAAG
jgi:DNA-binding NtrC family response regulator